MASYGTITVHKSPTMTGWGEFNVWREGNNIRVTGHAYLRKTAGSSSNPNFFGFHYAARIHHNGWDTGNWFYIKNDNTRYSGVDKTWDSAFDYTLYNVPDAATISLVYVCCGSGNGLYGAGCTVSGWETYEVASAGVDRAYTPSTIWMNPDDLIKIGKVGRDSWQAHYSYNSGSNTDCPITLAIHDGSATTWGVRWEPLLRKVTGSSPGVRDSVTLTTDRGFKHGSSYRFTLVSNGGEALSPSSWNPQDGYLSYTYQEPLIGSSCSKLRSTQNATQDNSFTISGTNNRAWSSYENAFQTGYKLKRGSEDWSANYTYIGNVTTWSRTAAEMRSLAPKNYDGQTITLRFRRYSSSADWLSDGYADASFIVYYRPRTGVTTSNTYYKKNNSNGTSLSKGNYIINDSSLTGVYVSWTYDTTTANAGYTQGYRIRLYNSSGSVVKTYYTRNKNYTIPKADIPKEQKTQIDITPYYGNDQADVANSSYAGSYWYYTASTPAKSDFVIMTSVLATPVITYPINNSTWVNKDFRVCFQLPIDPDKGNEPETYHYENVEININGNYTIRMTDSAGQTTSGTCVKSDNGPFSAKVANLTYQRKLVIYPNALGSMPTASNGKYSIKVRVKKKYGTSSSQTLWSPWSSIVNVTVSTPSFSPSKEGFIYASHFNNARTLVNNIRSAYGVSWSNIPSTATADNTIISRSQYYYSVMLTKLNETKNQINGYTTSYDVTKPKVDTANAIPTSFTTSNEHITAATSEDNSPDTPVGKNYIKIIYEKAILLK